MRSRLIAPLSLLLIAAAVDTVAARAAEAEKPLRPPAVPLVACDPYFSIWSCADKLTDDATRHWTGARHALTCLVRIDGKTYRLMGDEPKQFEPLPQTAVTVLPTRTICEFAGAGVRATMTFTTPALPDDLDVLSRPLTYIAWDVAATDGKEHAVEVFFAASGELAVNVPEQAIVSSREKVGPLVALKIGSEEQPVLQKKGDNLRIDWGYLYAAAAVEKAMTAMGPLEKCAAAFAKNGSAGDDDIRKGTPGDGRHVAALVLDLGKVAEKPASRWMMLAYDDLFAIDYFGQKQRAYWRRNGAEAADLLRAAAAEYEAIKGRCKRFDDELMADLTQVGGPKYARLAALAYRQCHAANKLTADANGQPLLWPKENFSNGCIATVDVIYPMAPQYLLLSPTLAKASLANVLCYAASPRWKWPFAPHDLGTYPKATGQVYGGGERTEQNQMPVEESGNMIILLAAIARIEGNADFASAYWPQVTKWAEYLETKGFDPENQLCTDDFAGHLAHNANLSIKAIEALGCYGLLCEMRGEKQRAAKYLKLAKELAAKWVEAAADGDRYRLAFDKPGTWSQKYNLVWDRMLGLNLFPADVATKEMAFYRKTMNRYGLPLDNRQPYTKLDWIVWTATLTGDRGDFDALVAPVYAFLDETPDRVPMTDWYFTDSGKKRGFQARPVVGGVFLPMLQDAAMWKKWAARDKNKAAGWAPIPAPPQVRTLVPTARERAKPAVWRYTIEKPADGWFRNGFDDSAWKEGPAGFGTKETPGAVVRTEWNAADIWLRREFELPQPPAGEVQLLLHHDEDAEVYLNGVLAARAGSFVTDYEPVPILPAAAATLRPGKNRLAVHCRQTKGGQYIDVGMVEVVAGRK